MYVALWLGALHLATAHGKLVGLKWSYHVGVAQVILFQRRQRPHAKTYDTRWENMQWKHDIPIRPKGRNKYQDQAPPTLTRLVEGKPTLLSSMSVLDLLFHENYGRVLFFPAPSYFKTAPNAFFPPLGPCLF